MMTMKSLFLVAVSALCLHAAVALASPEVSIKGLFKNAAVVVINGQQQLLKVGQRSAAGVLLVSASSREAVIEIDGKRSTLGLSQGIGTTYKTPGKQEVRLASKHNGHFFGNAAINGRRVQFLVDTGASAVSMSSKMADQLQIDYKDAKVVQVSTAQGISKAYEVTLRRVQVGEIRVTNVRGFIIEGEYPLEILLGNSFLSRVDVNIQNGVFVMTSKY